MSRVTADEQLHAIHAMLMSGHRSVHLERHTLLLIGAVGGFLSSTTEWVITNEHFPDRRQCALMFLLWLAFWLGGVSILDHYLTRRARSRRNEVLPFAQAQITRAWWMLLLVGTLASFAMFFYGGGAMIHGLWIVLLGLGIYLFGLFSRALIEWIGLATILLGVAGLAANLPFGATRWLNAACFVIGLPLAGWLASRVEEGQVTSRIAALALWIGAVVAPALLFASVSLTAPPSAPAVPLAAAGLVGNEEQTVHLAAGTRVALRIDLDSLMLTSTQQQEPALALTRPVDVVLRNGIPDGRYRIAGGAWHTIRDGAMTLAIDQVSPRIENGNPVVRIHARFDHRELEGEKE